MDRKPMGPGDWLIALLFGAILCVVAAGVFWRYFLGSPLVWTVELSRILFTWMIFVGAALAVKEGTHIRVSLLVDRLPPRTKRCLAVGGAILVAAFLGLMVFYGLQYLRIETASRTPALGLPQAYVWYSALPAALAVGCWFALRKAIEAWRGAPPPNAETRREG